MLETYKTIERYPDYEASTLGNIRNKKTGTVRKQTNRKGYRKIRLYNKDESVHVLVAETFIRKEHDGLQVNHIDGIKSNNKVDNLEWVTPSENVKHAFSTGLKKPSGGSPGIKIEDKTDECVYDSASECARKLGGTKQGVLYALRHKNIYKGHNIVINGDN